MVRLIDFKTLIAGKRPRSAIARSMTMWPSRMPRTASAIGSLWSSPSTRTVNRPVIGPATAPSGRTGAFQKLGQLAEHRGRIAFGCRRLAGGQADLALGHGEAGDRVHQAEDFL